MTRASPRACSDSDLRCDCHRKRPPATTATAATTRATILTSSPCARVQPAACSIPERNSSSLILCLSLLFIESASSLNGAPGPTRTGDLRFRKPLLYPAELRAHEGLSTDRLRLF